MYILLLYVHISLYTYFLRIYYNIKWFYVQVLKSTECIQKQELVLKYLGVDKVKSI